MSYREDLAVQTQKISAHKPTAAATERWCLHQTEIHLHLLCKKTWQPDHRFLINPVQWLGLGLGQGNPKAENPTSKTHCICYRQELATTENHPLEALLEWLSRGPGNPNTEFHLIDPVK